MLFTSANQAASYKGVILVGGPSVGTRFRPLSMDCPKPLFPIAGSPMINHHVDALQKIPGMKEILLIGFWENSVFDRFITERQIEFPHVSIRYLKEYQAMGTGGGLYHFRDEIARGNPDAFFVLNGDIASSFPLPELLSFHRRHQKPATVMGFKVPKNTANKFGCLVVEPEGSLVSHFVEKPESFISDLVSGGIYLFTTSAIFPYFSEAIEKRRRKEEDQGLDLRRFSNMSSAVAAAENKVQLEQDVLGLLVDNKLLHVFQASRDDFWMSIKNGSNLIPANRKYLQYFLQAQPRRLSTGGLTPVLGRLASPRQGVLTSPLSTVPAKPQPELIAPVWIHPTAIVHPSAKIGPNVSIGPRALIGRGVRIRDSIILDTVEIKNDACVINSVVGWESKIGAWSRVEGAPVNDDKEGATAKGYKVPSAAILGKDVIVSDEVIIRNCIVLPHKELKSSFQNEIVM